MLSAYGRRTKQFCAINLVSFSNSSIVLCNFYLAILWYKSFFVIKTRNGELKTVHGSLLFRRPH
jgi:hypothetical protein